MFFNKETGNIGENLAVNYLKKQNYKILQTNYRNKIGEIDIIANDKNTIVFIEVKTRSSLKFGTPSEAINFHKQQKIRNTAISYLKYKNLYEKVAVRFDCIEILGDKLDCKINHIKNIF